MQINEPSYYVYIVTNYKKTVLYTGMTNSLQQRVIEHYLNQNDETKFTGKYKAFYLLYYESHKYVNDAIAREKEIKGWRREKKIALIKTMNTELKFLNLELFGEWPPKNMYHRKDL